MEEDAGFFLWKEGIWRIERVNRRWLQFVLFGGGDDDDGREREGTQKGECEL